MLTRVGRKYFCPKGIRKYATKVAKKIRYAISQRTAFGMAKKSVVTTLSPNTSRERIRAKKNIHFMKVMTLYFEINGRKKPRYSEKLKLFKRRRAIPRGDEAEPPSA